MRPHLLCFTLFLAACPAAPIEGDEAGECDDSVDNDQDGATDCDDDQCAAATACQDSLDDTDPGDTPADTDGEPEPEPDDTDATDTDTVDPCDEDADGHQNASCGGEDCDDTDPNRHPSATELCDTALDEDCDGDPAGLGCEDGRGWTLEREEDLTAVPVDAVVQANDWGPRNVAGRDAVCISLGSGELRLDHGAAASAERAAIQVDLYLAPDANEAALRAARPANSSSYFLLRFRHHANETELVEYHNSLGTENDLKVGGGYAAQTWHTVRLEFDRTTGDVAAEINHTPWYEGSAFLASLTGNTLSLYGWGGDNGANKVCYSNLSVWTGGTIGWP